MHNFARSTLSAARSMELTMSAEFRRNQARIDHLNSK